MKKLFTTIFYLNIVFTQNVFLKQFSDQFADIAEKANPAVVTILTEKKIEINQSNRSTPQEDLFRFYFNQPRQREYKSSALGSGVIIDAKNGYEIEKKEFGNCFGTKEFIEGTTAFLEKRKAEF